MEHQTVRVVDNRPIAQGYYELTLDGPAAPAPGQFLTARVGGGIAPLLRRPFAYAGHDPATGQATVIYERRGNATMALTAYQAGDRLDILGPLGNRFPDPEPGTRPVLVAGGIGLGPLLFLYHDFKTRGLAPLLAVGARSGDRIPDLPVDALVATDDGAKGFKGTIIAALEASLAGAAGPDTSTSATSPAGAPPALTFYACGPHPMMAALRRWTLAGPWAREGLPSPRLWVSLEQTMACAVGACMGCVVRVDGPKPWARVCTEGPVFDAAHILWEDAK